MILGTGSHRYEVNHNWAKLPAGKHFGYTHGVVCDKNDNVYIFHQPASNPANNGGWQDALVVFDRDGNFKTSWAPEYAKGAHGLYYSVENGTEYLYLTDYELRQCDKWTLDGKKVLAFPIPPKPEIYMGQPYRPTDCCVAPNGDVYVFDGYGQPYVHCYDKNAKYKFSIGGPGKEAGQLSCPHAGNIDHRHGEPELYVADRGNNRIQVFTLDGKHKRFITEEQNMPCNFAYYKDEIYIPDLISRLTILDKNDKLIAHIGFGETMSKTPGWPNIQDKLQPGVFSSPHQCRVDSRGDVYVVEWISTGRVTKLTRQV
jgi:hypothetical protein